MKKILSIICSLMLCLSIGGFFATINQAYADEAPLLVSELFMPSGVELDPVSIDSEVTFLESGLKLSSASVKESARLKSQVVGDFSLEYFPERENGVATASKFSLTFTDESGKSFDLVVEHGTALNVYAQVNGAKAGVFYSNGKHGGLTTLCNGKGTYTQISAEKVALSFDPDTMSVYASSAGEMPTLVWCLTEEEIDGRNMGVTLSPFSKYSVDLTISGLSGVADYGSVILYTINGCPLDKMIVTESGNPAVSAFVSKNAIVGEVYQIPQGESYDVKDGISSDVSVTVSMGGSVISENKKSFTPYVSGEYTITYSAENSDGKKVEKSYTVTAYDQAPTYDYQIEWDLLNEYGVGDKITIPVITLSGGVLRYGEVLGKLSIKRNGVNLIGYNNINSGVKYTFRSVGTYTFSYDLGAGETLDYQVNVTDAKVRFIADGLKENYVKGTLIDASSFIVTDNGASVDYRFTVEFPNGKKYVNRKFVLSETGVYTIRAEYGEYLFEREITVKAHVTDFFSYTASGVSISHGKSDFTGRTGVVASVSSSGQLISYTQPINIANHVNVAEKNASGASKIKSNASPLIELSVDPRAYGTASAGGVNIYITDAANPENVITINVYNTGNSATWSYVRTAAPGQALAGFYTEGGDFVYDGTNGRIDYTYGFMIYNAAKGQLTTNTVTGQSFHASDSKVAIYFDNETKQIYSHNARAKTDIVMDLDDTRMVTLPWSGFESDYVYVSFSLAGVTSGGSKAIVYNIDGVDLSNNDLNYVANPKITLNDTNANIAGIKDRYLEVPKASATDCYGKELEVSQKVYYKVGERLVDVTVQNGKFLTDKTGTYYIVYRAIDAFKNVGEKTVEVQVQEVRPDVTLNIDESQAVKTGGVATQIPLYSPELVGVENAIGSFQVERKVYFGTGEDKVEVDTSSEAIYTEKAGDYLVEFSVTDGTGRHASVSYTLTVTAPDDPVVVSALPTFVGFVRGNSYEIPSVYYIDYKNGSGERTKADVYINGALFNGSIYSIARGDVEAKEAEELKETVTIEYKANDTVLETYSVPVKTVYKIKDTPMGILGTPIPEKYFLHERYFVLDEGVSVSPFVDRLTISSNVNDGTAYFVQPLASQNLSFEFDVDIDKNTLEKDENGAVKPYDNNLVSFKVTITDALDKSKSLVLIISNDPATNSVVMTVNGETSQPFTGSLAGITENIISFNYSNKTEKIYDVITGAELVVPRTYENGKPFAGFSDTVYVSIALTGETPSEGMSLKLHSLNGQNFASNTKKDTGNPYITVNGTLNGIFDVGQIITIPKATASDVFGSILKEDFTVSVTVENNDVISKVKDVNGLTLENVTPSVDYQVELSVAGTYRITYVAVDTNGTGADNPIEFLVTVTEQVKPIIKVKGS
ncbi:MAG: hypothetical protein IJV99_00800, partial [Clostridia bacterium]|nr:hypothetical protein [Clostridia bacterium]